MGWFIPCLAAAILNCMGLTIFRDTPERDGGCPIFTLYLFIMSMFILLWSVRTYPKELKPIGKLQFITEFLTAQFLTELLVTDFWVLLEKHCNIAIPNGVGKIEEFFIELEWLPADGLLTEILRSDTGRIILSSTLSVFFLLASLHASKIIDLETLLDEGLSCFLWEIKYKANRFIQRSLRSIGINRKRRVRINEARNSYSGCECPDVSSASVRKVKSKPSPPPSPPSYRKAKCDVFQQNRQKRKSSLGSRKPRKRLGNCQSDYSDLSSIDFEELDLTDGY